MVNWERVAFDELMRDNTKLGRKIKRDDYLPVGKYPIIDQGQEQVTGYTNSHEGLYTDLPAIIFGDHTRIIKYVDYPFFLGADGVKLLKSKRSDVDYRYLYHYFVSSPVINTGYNRHFKWLKEMSIPLPPLNEQRRIAATLDTVTGLIRLRKQQLEELDYLVKSRFVEMFGDPVSNPKRWQQIALGKRCEIITGNTPSRVNLENYGVFVEWIKSDNINTPSTYLTQAQEYLSEKGYNKCRYVQSGSVLMTCIAGSISCIGNVAVADRVVTFNQQINAIVPNTDETLYIYWLFLLSKLYIQSKINMSLKGILTKGQLALIKFPFPPCELQKQFAAFAQHVDNSKSSIQQSIVGLETLAKSLMQQFFDQG